MIAKSSFKMIEIICTDENNMPYCITLDPPDEDVLEVVPDTDYILLHVVAQGQSMIRFKVKKQAPLRKVKLAFCNKVDREEETVQLMYKGVPIEDDETPTTKEMINGDFIEVMYVEPLDDMD